MLELAQMLEGIDELRDLIQNVGPMRHDGLVTGIAGSARHLAYGSVFLTQSAAKKTSNTLFIITHSSSQAELIYEDLREFVPEEQLLYFPEREMAVADMIAYSPEVTSMRLTVLEQLVNGGSHIVVATIAAASQAVTAKSYFSQNVLTFTVGATMSLDEAVRTLVASGYQRVAQVERRGDFSLRGGILDIYPLTVANPYRIEWFDTEVDSIRTFEIDTQRSLEKLQVITVGPALDLLIPETVMQLAAEVLDHQLTERLRTVTQLDLRDRLQQVVGGDIHRLSSGFPFYGISRYTHLFAKQIQTILDYGSSSITLCLDEPSRLLERQKSMEKEFSEWLAGSLLRGEVLTGSIAEPDFSGIWESTKFARIQFSMFARPTGRFGKVVNLTAKTMQSFHGQMNLLKAEVARWQKSNIHVVFLAANKERRDRLQRVLEDYRIPAELSEQFQLSKTPQVMVGNLSAGFELPMQHIAVIVETEVFSAKKRNRRSRVELTDAERIKSYSELNVNDYVVHINHGIGKYVGIQTLEIEGRHKDYLHLVYAGNDSLYVPVEQIDQVQRYIGSEDKQPKVYHLGGGEWTRVKNKVSKTVKDIAEDLVKLYAKREATPGYAFAADTTWQKDFEGMFPYDETPDQLRAIVDIKRDMEKSRPMDRLLCGDVGYGKTEVAVRAAFKAVMDGKQVAILVPTTILAQQHFETFKERFSGFPVTVEVLSRFRSRSESQACIQGLKDGSVDVVIGTHRLLQKTIQFKDLGLLVVDEEQRFGVTHKERLKQIRANVDCLTLTATPIPRTLHMSMMGVRDLSVIETPPENRFPIQTYVVEFNEGLIREALERELGRGGQAYVLYNQVQSIRSMADRIARLVPGARIEVAHGQMSEEELERVMLDFLDGDIDVLVTTTIIETGLDIPNVNTLVVSDADKLGLSQLYQLRGRVGRSNRIAYAYFTYQKDKVLTEVAEKRLQAIKEFTELGSGFKIAMRDLSIRGAGNLLGAEQHGFINSVGFDMYSEMLSQAVKEIRGDKQVEEIEPSIDLQLEAYLPDSYIPDAAQKIAMYKKFKYVRSQDAANDLEEELEDRYGDLPDVVRNLIDITRLKSYAVNCGVDAISQAGSETSIRFPVDAKAPVNASEVLSLALKYHGQPTKRPNGTFFVSFRTRGMAEREIIQKLLRFLAEYSLSVRPTEEVEQLAK